MRVTLLLCLVAATAPAVHGHFRVMRIAHNGVWQEPVRYLRNITQHFAESSNPDPAQFGLDRTWTDPTYYVDLAESVRCGRDNMRHAPHTETLKVKAGDTLEFAWASSWPFEFNKRNLNCEDGRGFCEVQEGTGNRYRSYIIHSGPVSTYLSAVPEGVGIEKYDGSGDWVKIYTAGVEILKGRKKPHWLPNNNDDVNYASGTQNFPVRMPFKIPEQTPAGKYLLRVDLVYTFRENSYAQVYPSCAHIEVESTASGLLPSGVKFPEVYKPDMPGMTASNSHSVGYSVDPDYVYPGGDLWNGEEMVVDRPDLTPK